MRIGIDARLNAYRQGGIPQYTRQLLAALAALAPGETFIALQHRRQPAPLVTAPNVRRATLVTPPHHRLEQLTLPAELLPRRLDLLHAPDFIAPSLRPCPAVVTVHDLAFVRYPEILDDGARRYYGRVGRAIREAQAVIAVSEATRADIAELLGFPAERVAVVPEAAAPHFRPLAVAPGEARAVNGVELVAGGYLLFVSTIEPRKNLPLLLKALRVCLDRRPTTAYRLVIAGARGWRDGPIFQALADLRLAGAVTILDSVAQPDLVWLYSACRLYACPSRYEGFGLPVLEALACGAPALVADTSSLPEVAGDAAMLLPVDDHLAWADAIEALWHDDARRADLARRGPPQAARFSWERAAAATLAIYRRAAA